MNQSDTDKLEEIGVPYGSRTRVAAVKEKRPIVIQWNFAAITPRQGELWRQARAAYQKSLEAVRKLDEKGLIPSGGANWPKNTARQIATIDAVLAQSN